MGLIKKFWKGREIDISGEQSPGKKPNALKTAEELAEAPENIKTTKFRARWYKLPEGAAWNPLKGFPVNKPCWCGSRKKAKKCCLPHASNCISQELASNIKTNWRRLVNGTWTLPPAPKED